MSVQQCAYMITRRITKIVEPCGDNAFNEHNGIWYCKKHVGIVRLRDIKAAAKLQQQQQPQQQQPATRSDLLSSNNNSLTQKQSPVIEYTPIEYKEVYPPASELPNNYEETIAITPPSPKPPIIPPEPSPKTPEPINNLKYKNSASVREALDKIKIKGEKPQTPIKKSVKKKEPSSLLLVTVDDDVVDDDTVDEFIGIEHGGFVASLDINDDDNEDEDEKELFYAMSISSLRCGEEVMAGIGYDLTGTTNCLVAIKRTKQYIDRIFYEMFPEGTKLSASVKLAALIAHTAYTQMCLNKIMKERQLRVPEPKTGQLIKHESHTPITEDTTQTTICIP